MQKTLVTAFPLLNSEEPWGTVGGGVGIVKSKRWSPSSSLDPQGTQVSNEGLGLITSGLLCPTRFSKYPTTGNCEAVLQAMVAQDLLNNIVRNEPLVSGLLGIPVNPTLSLMLHGPHFRTKMVVARHCIHPGYGREVYYHIRRFKGPMTMDIRGPSYSFV